MSFIDKVFDKLARSSSMLFILNTLLLLLSLFPKKGLKIVFFGAMNGRWYGDNSKHLFEYICSLNDVPFRFYWVTKNSSVYRQLRAKGLPVLYQFSLRYLIALSRCEMALYTDSLRDLLLNPMLGNLRFRTINLRHGRSVKRVRFARKNHQLSFKEELERRHETDLTAFSVSTSEFISDLQEECLLLGRDRHVVTGYPRNDDLIRRGKQRRSSEVIKILYAPSWRHGRKPTKFFPFDAYELRLLDKQLRERNIELFLRPHVGEISSAGLPSLASLKSIKLFDHRTQPDINSSLHEFDLLISDYSALIHDYLLLDRPIVLIPYDFADFEHESGFLYDYFENAPGIIVNSGEEFSRAILDREAFSDKYTLQRRALRDKIHEIQDDKACNRVYKLIKECINV